MAIFIWHFPELIKENLLRRKALTDGTKYKHMMKEMIAKEGPGGANAKQVIEMTGNDLGGNEH